MSETVLNTDVLQNLRLQKIITENEVAVNVGDLYYAKNVLTNEKRLINASLIGKHKNENLQETNQKTLLKG
jgi:hypothetical protein